MNPNDWKAHRVEPEFGTPYWRVFATCSDGSVVIGQGMTAVAAELDTTNAVKEKEAYLALPDIEKLKILVEGKLLDTDKIEAIRIMAKLLIKYEIQTSRTAL